MRSVSAKENNHTVVQRCIYLCTCSIEAAEAVYLTLLQLHFMLELGISYGVLIFLSCHCLLSLKFSLHFHFSIYGLTLLPTCTYMYVLSPTYMHERSVLETWQHKATIPKNNSIYPEKNLAASGGVRTCNILPATN